MEEKLNLEQKIKELEKRIELLEARPYYHPPVYPPYQPPQPLYNPIYPPYYVTS